MKANGRLVLAKVTCRRDACRVIRFTASVRFGNRTLKLKTAIPDPIAAGRSARLIATVRARSRSAVRSARPKAIARFTAFTVSDSKGRVERPGMKVRIR